MHAEIWRCTCNLPEFKMFQENDDNDFNKTPHYPCEQKRMKENILPVFGQFTEECGRKDYDRCVRLADPLLTDPHLIFPDNMGDIDHVCRTWSKFVDCIKSYIDRCFTETRRNQFNKAVESPVDSVHQMCTSSSYQQEYLQHASCLKSTLTDDTHCGRHYKQLVAQVQGPKEMGRADLCCSHQRFRDCVLTETKRVCDAKLKVSSKMMPSAFSRQILDKALSFLREQCSSYVPNAGDCPGYQPTISRQEDNYIKPNSNKVLPTPAVETKYLTNDQVFSENFQEQQKTVQEQQTINPLSWIPSSRDGRRKTPKPTDLELQDPKTTTSMEDSSSRSSYGRGISMNTTDDIFKPTHYKPSTESWYPRNTINSFGSEKELNVFQSNDVDEPNQQGLSRRESPNSGSLISLSFTCILVLFISVLYSP